MATISTLYLGDMRTEMTHNASGNKIITDAPVDNKGKGEFFSPTDMVAGALGSCMLTLMAQAADTGGFDIDGTKLEINKVMASNPRRIAEIVVDVHFAHGYTPKQKAILERAAALCPVAASLHPDTKETMNFIYPEE